jgi:hypothetical protein
MPWTTSSLTAVQMVPGKGGTEGEAVALVGGLSVLGADELLGDPVEFSEPDSGADVGA